MQLEREVQTTGDVIAVCKKSNPTAERVAQTVLLAVLLVVPTLMCLHTAVVGDADIWWHLRTGEWILAHHTVPRIDSYSAQLAGTRWLAYSWSFELLMIKLFHRLGLVGLVVYSSTMILGITIALYHLLRRLQSDFSLTIVLTFAGLFGIGHLYTPRPWMFTILFFIFELDILMHARRTGRVRELLWLPGIFALWANVHVEFIYGLAVLGLAFAESVVARWWSAAEVRVGTAWMGAALAASTLATLANPFGWRIYGVIYEYTTQSAAFSLISELQAIPFRGIVDFSILIFALTSAAALAWQRRFLLFETGALAFAVILSFRAQRDEWSMVVIGAMILASNLRLNRKPAQQLPWFATALAVLTATLAIPMGLRAMHIDNPHLQTKLAKDLPVQAVETIRARGYAGPLYNDFSWGGYLIWALRMPVSIDGRSNLYGDDRLNRSVATWNAQPDWGDDTQLKSARLAIGPVKSPLTQILRLDPHFQLVYEDKLAAVFVARR